MSAQPGDALDHEARKAGLPFNAFVLLFVSMSIVVLFRGILNADTLLRVAGVFFGIIVGFTGFQKISTMPQDDDETHKQTETSTNDLKSNSPCVRNKEQLIHTPAISTKKDLVDKQVSHKKSSSNTKQNVPAQSQVIYLNNVPNDVGFGRGDQRAGVRLSAKIYIPEVKGYNFIGRILGPRGISARRLEAETECKILIRGRGSIKDEKREQYLMNRAGWAHLHEKLHVLLLATGESLEECRERLDGASQIIQRLLIPQYDEYKRKQLVHLAILNGTYRP